MTARPVGIPGMQTRVRPLCYAQVDKVREGGRVVEVRRQLIFGTEGEIAHILRQTKCGAQINTSFIERDNLTSRQSKGKIPRMTVPAEPPAPQTTSTHPYLDLVHQGKNDWWRYLLSFAIIFSLWIVLGSIPALVAGLSVIFDGNPDTIFDTASGAFEGVHPLLPFIAIMLSFVFFLAAIYLAVVYVHRRPFATLVAPAAFNWPRFAQAFGLWFLFGAIFAVFEALLHPGRYALPFNAANFIPFLFFALVFIPIQTSAEELFFRAYILQSASLRIKKNLNLILLSGFLFMLPHSANPEISVNLLLLPIFYFLFGAFLAYLTLKTNGLELALGIHTANNLFTALFANYAQSALPTPSIFTANELDAGYNLFGFFFTAIVFYLWFFWPEKKPDSASVRP